jgi:hypothetical protein
MTFTLLGNLIEGTSDIIHGGITKAHRITDDTLDHTGLSAFIPPALHEVSDATFGLVQRGILDVGHTSGSVLRSFEWVTGLLHDRSVLTSTYKPTTSSCPRQGDWVSLSLGMFGYRADICV